MKKYSEENIAEKLLDIAIGKAVIALAKQGEEVNSTNIVAKIKNNADKIKTPITQQYYEKARAILLKNK